MEPTEPMEPMDADRAPALLRGKVSWLLNQAANPANRLVNEALAGEGLRRHHFALLAALDEVGPSSQADLSRRTTIDRSDMVATVDDLAARGDVERAPDPADRRRNVITLTPAGRRHLRHLDALLTAAQDEILAPLTPADRTTLLRLLTTLATRPSPEAT
jgi:MarR family transcriptional regulator, lower aerobic nicotinate degradation pathway regulator